MNYQKNRSFLYVVSYSGLYRRPDMAGILIGNLWDVIYVDLLPRIFQFVVDS